MSNKKLRSEEEDDDTGRLLQVEQYTEYNEEQCLALQQELKCDDEEIAQRCYSARLIGSRSTLVLHGGGNCSVKLQRNNLFNELVDWLAVKGSGYDLSNIVPRGFPLVRLDHLKRMCDLQHITDDLMVNEFRSNLKDSTSPTPSVESLLHAMIDAKFVDHSHASAVVALACQTESKAQELFQRAFAGCEDLTPFCIVPYVMPGFDLAREAKRVLKENPNCKAMILLKHGLFTWGNTAKQSYDRHIMAVNQCEKLIANSSSSMEDIAQSPIVSPEYYSKFASVLRGVLHKLDASKHKWIVSKRENALAASTFCHCAHSQRGCCTPDHVIRTKRVPLVILDLQEDSSDLEKVLTRHVEQYITDYQSYFVEHERMHNGKLKQLDALPRVLLVENVGLVTIGRTYAETQISADIYEESMRTILSALQVAQNYEPCTPREVFDVEYWVLEQAKLKVSTLPMLGQVCLVTGGGSGIGLETAKRFAKEGCAVFILDRDLERVQQSGFQGMQVDVTNREQIRKAFQECCRVFGGVDVLVSNAGVFNCGSMCWEAEAELQDSMQVNFFAHHIVSSIAVEIMKLQAYGGCLLFNVSKAPMNPGSKAGAYAIAKAATGALMRQLALECAEFGITSNAVNADRVRTNLFDLDLVTARAAARNLSVDQYFSSNLLGREVTSRDVADAFYLLAQSTKTTGTYFCVDGGCLASAPK